MSQSSAYADADQASCLCPDLSRTLAEIAAATSVHVVAIIEPIIQHADWFFPGGEISQCLNLLPTLDTFDLFSSSQTSTLTFRACLLCPPIHPSWTVTLAWTGSAPPAKGGRTGTARPLVKTGTCLVPTSASACP